MSTYNNSSKLATVAVPIKNFFLRGSERTIKIKRNIFLSFIIKGLSILISLLLVPLTIDYVNPTRYGVWLTLSSIVAWFSFFDIGFGNGLRNKFAEALALGKIKLARIYLSTTYAILGIITIALLLVFLAVNPLLDWTAILNTGGEMRQELSLLASVVFFFFCINFVLQLLTVVMTANQQPARASLITLAGNAGSLVLVFLLTKFTNGNLLYLGIALSSSPVIILFFASIWLYKNNFAKFSPKLNLVNFKFARNLIGLGAKFFIIQISTLFLFQTNNVIISQVLGPEEVTPYNVAFRYFGIAQMIFTIVLSPFWSAYTDAYFKRDFVWIKSITRKLMLSWLAVLALIIVLLLFSKTLYRVWVGPEILIPLQLSFACALYVLIITWSSIFVNFINGVGKIKMQLYFSVFIAVFNIPLSLFLIKNMNLGVTGLVYSNCICLGAGAVLASVQYVKIMNRSESGIWSQ